MAHGLAWRYRACLVPAPRAPPLYARECPRIRRSELPRPLRLLVPASETGTERMFAWWAAVCHDADATVGAEPMLGRCAVGGWAPRCGGGQGGHGLRMGLKGVWSPLLVARHVKAFRGSWRLQ